MGPRIHSAVCMMESNEHISKAFTATVLSETDAWKDPQNDTEIAQSTMKDNAPCYWIMDQIFLLLGFWKHKECFKLTSPRDFFSGKDALLHGDDPLPFLAM